MSEKHYPCAGGEFDRIVFDGDGSVWVRERTCKMEMLPPDETRMRWMCSECSAFMDSQMRYCPNCGAKVVE